MQAAAYKLVVSEDLPNVPYLTVALPRRQLCLFFRLNGFCDSSHMQSPTRQTSTDNVCDLQALDYYIFLSQGFVFLVSVEITYVGNVAIFDHEEHCGAVGINGAASVHALAYLVTCRYSKMHRYSTQSSRKISLSRACFKAALT